MDIHNFQRTLIRRINDRLPEGIRAKSRKIKRNNNTASDAIVPVFTVPRLSGAVLYTEDFYAAFLSGEELDSLADKAAQALQLTLPDEFADGSLFTREFVENRTVIRLLSRERNEELLQNLVSRPFLDLALTYAMIVPYPGDPRETGMVAVSKDLLRDTGLTEEELYAHARDNSARLLGPEILGMDELLREGSVSAELSGNSVPCIYVATNRLRRYGAAVMAYSDGISKLSQELGCDLVILPSSVHELILYPYCGQNPEDLKLLVQSVNESEVRPDEVLSDSVYIYRYREDCMDILA